MASERRGYAACRTRLQGGCDPAGISVTAMRGDDTLSEWLDLIRAEYSEIPGLSLTKPQVRRLWNLDPPTCEAVLEALQADRFLRQTPTGAYVRAES